MSVILNCLRTRFYSRGDEAAFFEWIGRISCIARFEGAGDVLLLHVPRKRISDGSLRELIALFYRYDIDMQQLAPFEHPANRSWFKNPGAFWFRRVWKPKRRSATGRVSR